MRRLIRTVSLLSLVLFCVHAGLVGGAEHGGVADLPAAVADAKPGEWASYQYSKDLFDGVDVEIRITVLGVSGAGNSQFQARVDTTLDGEPGKSSEQVHPVNDGFFVLQNFREAELEFFPATISVLGREMPGIEARGDWQGFPLTISVSEEIPALGLARVVWGSETLLDITDFAFAK